MPPARFGRLTVESVCQGALKVRQDLRRVPRAEGRGFVHSGCGRFLYSVPKVPYLPSIKEFDNTDASPGIPVPDGLPRN